MLNKLNERLIEIKVELRKKRKWEKQLALYKAEQMNMKEKVYNLKDQLTEEQADVDQLKGIGVTNLLYTILGTKERRIEEEKKEVAAVQLKLKEATEARDEINQSIVELQKHLLAVKGLEREYENILATKEEYIKGSASPNSQRLTELTEREGDTVAYLAELKEAIQAGEAVTQTLSMAIRSLEKANGWGTLDMLGGGMISSLAKHNHIDDASAYIHQAQSKMRSFQKELLDVDEEAHLDVDLSSMLKFADFFFDGLIVDWMVQGKINDALERTNAQSNQIHSLLNELKYQADQQEKELEQILHEKKQLIESV
ncbi:hypothetical protein ACSVDE_13790 [Pseudalkalibacillus sp. Hm43]|uniref:hypothetical protein n=1 Tax=Pseudalkalibacillus sp. Hm43 TaxID=3450742 RepID=UPI003F434795